MAWRLGLRFAAVFMVGVTLAGVLATYGLWLSLIACSPALPASSTGAAGQAFLTQSERCNSVADLVGVAGTGTFAAFTAGLAAVLVDQGVGIVAHRRARATAPAPPA